MPDAYVLSGELDVATASAWAGELRSYSAARTGNILLDCAAVTFIDSSGLRALVVISKQLREAGRTMQLVNPPPFFRRRLEVAGLLDLFTVAPPAGSELKSR